ncbi:MAG: rubrerythrin family protein [Clostridia bacterium]|nr:rubrerythrin family protein [Clostridia bacterium]
MDFKTSETKLNLMRAFAGESQARNRYTIAAGQAKKENLHVVEAVFNYIAGQELEHAKIFYNYLSQVAGETLKIEGGYPVDIASTTAELLRMAAHNEFEEYEDAYPSFANTAESEGFVQIAASFRNIAEIEKSHGDRFKMFATMLETDRLFVSDVACEWVCLNCGHTFTGEKVPEMCPVCQHNKGYFIRLEFAPYARVQDK